MLKSFVYAGKDSKEFGVYISGDGTYAAPQREVEAVSVPGRNGDLLYDNGRYPNVPHTYRCGIVRDFEQNYAAFRNFLLSQRGYQRLQDAYHPEEFYEAYVSADLNPNLTANLKRGEFEVVFTRKPQRFLEGGDHAVALSQGTIYNPTLFASRPLLTLYGTGTITVNDTIVTITGSQAFTVIDCDLGDAYMGSLNLNDKVTVSGYDFPTLEPGENTIALSGVTGTIRPRWYIL